MGIYLSALDFNKAFSQLKMPPIIINDVVDSSVEQKQQLSSSIYTTYTDDLLSNIPACECGTVTGEYNLGIVCPNCQTEVKHPHGDLESFVWLKAPEGVRALISPTVWLMLSKYFTKGNFNLIKYLADATYRPEVKQPDFMVYVDSFGFQRGLNYFIDNFDRIIEALFSLKAFKKNAQESHLEDFLRRHRSCVFSQYIPLPNKTLLVVEETNSGTYIDPVLTGGIDAIRTLVGIDSPLANHSIRVKENRTIKCIDKLSEFYLEYYKTTLAKKEGIFRKHIYGTRSHFSTRAVITSLTDPHNYDEIQIPWGVAISLLEVHLTNKLIRRGMTPNQIIGFLYAHSCKYHPLLDDLFKELIRESPNNGIECVLTRNPSLQRASCQALRISAVKTDVNINTISMSILIVRGLNADFDGDAVGVTLSIDQYIANGLSHLAPHKSTFDLDQVRSVSSNLMIPKPVISTIANWLDTD